MTRKYETLTQEEVDTFMERGYIVLKGAFTKEKCAEWTKDVWVRLGIDPADKSTYAATGKDRVHMPDHNKERVETFAPRAWAAMKDLLGGEDRIELASATWNDAFIVNLGAEQWEKEDLVIHPHDLDNWHVDGDFFVHYLDSPEQALLVIPVFSEIKPRGGGTYICPQGIGMIANYLAAHPEGALPTGLSFTPSTSTYENHQDHPDYLSNLKEIKKCDDFVEVTGEVGDVVLMHPLMMHSASKNHLRIPRIITNPPVSLKQPFNFNRENSDEFSLVELKTLKELGVDRLPFQITTERRRIVPKRLIEARRRFEEEQKRLASLKVESVPLGVASRSIPVQ